MMFDVFGFETSTPLKKIELGERTRDGGKETRGRPR